MADAVRAARVADVSARAIPVALSAAAGVSVWLSVGVVAVTDAASRARIGILPSFWVLALAVAACAGAALLLRPSTRRALPLSLALLLWLPWLPGPIPEAFLIWSGPVAWLVWAAVAVGLAWPVVGRVAASRWLTDPRRAPALALVVAAVCYLASAGLLRHRLPGGDEPHYLVITQSLLADRDLRIENNHARGDYAPYFSGELAPDYLRRGLDGEIYSIHAAGVSALVLPAFAVAGYPGAVLTIALLMAFAMAGLWVVAWQLTASAHAAWVAWASVALTTPMFFHGFTIYPDGAGAACSVAGLWLLVALDNGRRVSRLTLAACGAALAMLPWLHTRFAIVAGLLGLAAVLRLLWRPAAAEMPRPGAARGQLADAAVFLAVPIVSAAFWFGYFWTIWGTIDPAAPYGGYTQSAWSHLWPGLSGLLGDQQFGLVASAPIYLSAMAGFLPLARQRPRLAVELGILAVTYTVAVASYRMWWGGFSAPARFLIVILPVAAIPMAALWRSCRTPAARAVVLAVLALSVALVLPRLVIEEGALLYNVRDGFDLLLDWANRSVNLPLAFPSLHRDVPGDGLADIATWLASAAFCLAAGWQAATRRGDPWTWACASLAATAMVASTLVWTRYDHAVTPDTSALNLLHQWDGRRHTVGWQSRPWALSSQAEAPLHVRLATSSRGPRQARDVALFDAPLVPAGDYEVVVSGSARPSGTLTVSVGRSTLALQHFDLDGRPSGPTGLVVRLPVRVRSLSIHGDNEALRTVAALHLQPRHVRDDDRKTDGVALGAARYGAARVFFMDDRAYMEPEGFWTRAEASTRIVIDSAGEPVSPALVVRAGPVEATVEVTAGQWAQALPLLPGESRRVVIPTKPGVEAWEIEVATGAGFRPAWHDPSARDMRNLGVWCVVN